MTNTLIPDPAVLEGFPGYPFPESILDSAVASLRQLLGWSVAPVEITTLLLDHDGGPELILPSRRVVDVTAVRDEDGTPITGWKLTAHATLVGPRWPTGPAAVEVDIEHGYDTIPPDLLPSLASAMQVTRRSLGAVMESAQPFMVQYAAPEQVRSALAADPALTHYTARTL